MKTLSLFFFLATIIATCQGASHPVPGDHNPSFDYLSWRLAIDTDVHHDSGFNCLSWRLAVETNNIRDWVVVPKSCISYVVYYMLGDQYRKDVQAVVDAAVDYAKRVPLPKDLRNTWIFGLGETVLSNLPYYAQPEIAFGGTPFNSTKFEIWEKKGIAPAVPEMLDLYNKLQSLGYKIVLISTSSECLRATITKNLKNLGFANWEKLILMHCDDSTTSKLFKEKKRNELVAQGYRIIGNVGDQWSDLTGEHVGHRTFKVPNPMYYVLQLPKD